MLSREEKISTTKLSAVQYVLLLVMVILVARLWKLQVGGNDRYETLAEQNANVAKWYALRRQRGQM